MGEGWVRVGAAAMATVAVARATEDAEALEPLEGSKEAA